MEIYHQFVGHKNNKIKTIVTNKTNVAVQMARYKNWHCAKPIP